MLKKATKQNNPYWQITTKNLESSLAWFFKSFINLFWNSYPSTISDNFKIYLKIWLEKYYQQFEYGGFKGYVVS
jgi:hypothetical protein